jgi:hypothetical protein
LKSSKAVKFGNTIASDFNATAFLSRRQMATQKTRGPRCGFPYRFDKTDEL